MVTAKRDGSGGTRHFRIGINSNWDYTIVNYGSNNIAGTWINSFTINYTCLANAMYFNSTRNIGIGTSSPYTKTRVKGTNPILTIMGQGGSGAMSQINLSTYDTTTSNSSNCSLIATDNGNFGATFQIN